MGKARKDNVEAQRATRSSSMQFIWSVESQNYARESKNVNGWINGCTSRQNYVRERNQECKWMD